MVKPNSAIVPLHILFCWCRFSADFLAVTSAVEQLLPQDDVDRRLSDMEEMPHSCSPSLTFSRKLLFSSNGVMAWTNLMGKKNKTEINNLLGTQEILRYLSIMMCIYYTLILSSSLIYSKLLNIKIKSTFAFSILF